MHYIITILYNCIIIVKQNLGNDSEVKIWHVDIKNKRAVFTLSHTLTDHSVNIMCVAFSPSGKQMIYLSYAHFLLLII